MDLLIELFTLKEFQLLMYCALAAAIGGFLKSLVITYNFDAPHHRQEKIDAKDWSSALANVISRCLLGAFSGLMYALLMVSAIKMEQGAVAKLIVVAVIIGYLSPNLWKSQEKIMLDRITKEFESSIKTALQDKNVED